MENIKTIDVSKRKAPYAVRKVSNVKKKKKKGFFSHFLDAFLFLSLFD